MTDPGIPETGHFKTTLDPRALELQKVANDALARLAQAEAECERLRAALQQIADLEGTRRGEWPAQDHACVIARAALGEADSE